MFLVWNWRAMNRLAVAVLALAAGLAPVAWSQTPQGKAERRDPIFLRFPEMAERYWVNTETNAASHKVVAIPLPRQCSFVYADSYSRGQMSQSEVEQMAVSSCNQKLGQLGPLGENFAADCRCQVVISNERYVVPRNMLPDDSYGPVSIFYRDDRGNVARLNGLAKYGALIGRDRSVRFAVDNPRGEQVCEGTFTNEAPGNGNFSISCFAGRFSGTGTYQSKTGAPNDHIIARGHTNRGLPIVMVIGLPAQLAANTYGAI
jgi:hypothetical protein